MSLWMLDTNTVSQLVRGHPRVVQRVTDASMAMLKLSAITEGELLFGLERRPQATQLHRVIHEMLQRIEVLEWDRAAAQQYAALRASLERQGTPIAPIDLLIAAHALSVGAMLVTNDKTFRHATALKCEDWSA